ncbi:hypothetical protein D3C72_1699880 [compost metagenome]
MDVRGHVHLAQLFVQRIPVAITQPRPVRTGVLIGVGVQQHALEAQVVDATVQFAKGVFNRLSRHLRQAAHADETVGEELGLAMDDGVALFHEPVNHPARLEAGHHLEGARRDQLNVRPVAVQHVHMAARRHLDLVHRAPDVVVADAHAAPTMRSAMRQGGRLVGPQFGWRADMPMTVDDHDFPSDSGSGRSVCGLRVRIGVAWRFGSGLAA